MLSHLHEVPSCGYVYGLFWSVRYLIKDDSVYPLVKEALMQINPNDKKFILQILEGTDMPKILGIGHTVLWTGFFCPGMDIAGIVVNHK